jgi:outer membrane protein
MKKAVITIVVLCSFSLVLAEPPRPGELVLTLGSSVDQALTNNYALKSTETDLKIADRHFRGQKAYWEPALVLTAEQEENRKENTIQEELSMFTEVFEEENSEYSVAIEGLLGSGAKYRLGYTVSDLANNLTNLTFREIAPFTSEYVSFAGINLVQPLLKNGGFTAARSKMKDARLAREIARQTLRRQKMLTIARTEIAFWNVLESDHILDLRAQSLEIAKSLVKDNESRLEQGKMAEMEVEQARVGAARRERLWLEAKAQRNDAVRGLMNAMGRQIGEEQIVISDEEGLPQVQAFDPGNMMNMALERHPDMLIAVKEVELRDLRLAVAKNQRWPQMDLVGSYGLNGLGDSMTTSRQDVEDGEFESWSVGIVARLPLGGDRAAAAELKKARLEKTKALDNYKATETDVANALQTAVVKSSLLEKALTALDKEVAISKMALENEKVLLENGKSTSRRLLELEENLCGSRVERAKAGTALRRVLVQVDLSDGGMLVRRDLE